MTDTGWKNPQNVAQDSRRDVNYGRMCYAFKDLGNIKKGSKDYFSDIRIWSVTGIDSVHRSPFVYAYNYGFNIPSNATVKKIHFFTMIQQMTHPKPYYERIVGKRRYSISKFHSVKLKTGASVLGEGNGNNMKDKAGVQKLPYMVWSTEAQTTFSGTPEEWGLKGDNIVSIINSGNFGIVLQVIGTIYQGWVNPAIAAMKMKIEYEVPAVVETPKCEFTKLVVTCGGKEVKFNNNLESDVLGTLDYSDYEKPITVEFNFYHKGMSGETPIMIFESRGLSMGATKNAYIEGKYSTSKYTMSGLHCNTDENEKKYTQNLVVFPGSLLGIQTITYTYNKKKYTLRFNVDTLTLTDAEKAKFMNADQQCIVKNSLFYKNHAIGIGGAMCITSEFFTESRNIYGIMITETEMDKSYTGNVNLIPSNFIQANLLTSNATKNVAPTTTKDGFLNIGQKGTVYYKNPIKVSSNTNETIEIILNLNSVGANDGRFGILNFNSSGAVRNYFGTSIPTATYGEHAYFRITVTGTSYKIINVKTGATVYEHGLTLHTDNNDWYVYFLSSTSGKIAIESFNTAPLLLSDLFGDAKTDTVVQRSKTVDNKICLGQKHNTGIYFPSNTKEWKVKVTFEIVEKGSSSPLQMSIPNTGFEMFVNNSFVTKINNVTEHPFIDGSVKSNTLHIERNDDDLYIWYVSTDKKIVQKEYKPSKWGGYLFMLAREGSTVNILGYGKMKGILDNSNIADNKKNENNGVQCHNTAWLGENKLVAWSDFTSAKAGDNYENHYINDRNEFVVGHNNYLYFTIPDKKEWVIGVTFRKSPLTDHSSWYTMGIVQKSGKSNTYYRVSEAVTATKDYSQFEYLDEIGKKQLKEETTNIPDGIAGNNLENTIFFIKKGSRFAIQFNNVRGVMKERSWDYAYVKNTRFYIRSYLTTLVLTEFSFV